MEIPPLTAIDREVSARLEAWDQRSPRGTVTHRAEVLVSIGGDAVIDEGATITEAERAAYERVFRDAPAMRERILDALAKSDRAARAGATRENIASRVRLQTVSILRVEREGVAYVGYGLSCDWDDEHGAGVMTHKERIVEAGGGDTAILSWIAKRDGGTAIEAGGEKKAKKGAAKKARR